MFIVNAIVTTSYLIRLVWCSRSQLKYFYENAFYLIQYLMLLKALKLFLSF